MHAATEAAADKFRRRVGNNYANSEVFPRRRWSCLPRYRPPDEYVAGAWLEMEKLPYYPIRHHNSDEWATDPYGEITSEMFSLTTARSSRKVVFRPAKQSWTDGDRFKHNSVDDLAHALRQGNISWMARSPNAASEPEGQAGRQNHRTAAWPASVPRQHPRPRSLHGQERSRSACPWGRRDVQKVLQRHDRTGPRRYTSVASKESKRASQLRQHVARMADREWTDRRMIMTVDELAGVAHIPNNGSRRRTSTGATPSVAIGFLLIRISTTTQQPDTVLAIDRLDKEGRIVFDRFFGRDDDQDAASNADAASDESAESDAGPMAETSPGPQSLLGETYDITEQNTDYVGSKARHHRDAK